MKGKKKYAVLLIAIISMFCMAAVSFAGINNRTFIAYKLNGTTKKTLSPFTMYTGEVYTLQITDLYDASGKSSSINSVSIKSNSPSIVSVKRINTKTVSLTAKKAGTVDLSISVKSGLLTMSRNIAVKVNNNTISSNKSSIKSGDLVTFTLAHTTGIRSYTWSTSSSSIAKPVYKNSKSNKFQVGILKNGSPSIKVRVNGVTIQKRITANKNNMVYGGKTCKAGRKISLKLESSLLMGVKYKSANNMIAKATSSGMVEGRNVGKTTVSAIGKKGFRHRDLSGRNINFAAEVNYIWNVSIIR